MSEKELITSYNYFGYSPVGGWNAKDADGYTKEEKMLLDESPKTLFYNTLADWMEDAAWYRTHGFSIFNIVKMTDGRVAVLTC